MKRVLLVVSTWKPCMMADMQRARLIAGELPNFGWEAEILAPDASFQTDFSRVQGEGLDFPDVPVHEFGQWWPGLFRMLGSRNVGIRAAIPAGKAGLDLLRRKNFDLVYFSTTQHWITCNGARWRRKTGVPYVADLHDPVYLEKKVYFVSRHRMKERLARLLGKKIEQWALGRADGLVSVSQGYVDDVARRNPGATWISNGTVLVQPFPADLAALTKALRPMHGERRHRLDVVYIGAGGSIMEKGWGELIRCLGAANRSPDLRIRLVGTDTNWGVNRCKPLQEAAERAGLGGLVEEQPGRISYTEAIACTKTADGLLVLGVDDPNYMPSKLNTCLAAGAPLLVTMRESSALGRVACDAGPGIHTVIFGQQGKSDGNVRSVDAFLREVISQKRWAAGERRFLQAGVGAREHARLFDRVVATHLS